MELQNFLLEALKERFKANATVVALESQIKSIAESKTFEKYKNKKLLNDGMEFELFGVKSLFYTYNSDIKLNNIELRLAFFCKSELTKVKREKLEKVKLIYQQYNYLEWNNYKKPIWKELIYSVELENVLSGNINLRIE